MVLFVVEGAAEGVGGYLWSGLPFQSKLFE